MSKRDYDNSEIIKKFLNNDEILIDQYLQKYRSVQSTSDISHISDKLKPILDAYDTSLIKARNFLNQYTYMFPNKVELRRQICDKIVNSQIIKDSVNVFIEDYDREVADYNKRVQTVSGLFRLLI